MDSSLLKWTPQGSDQYPNYPGACDFPDGQVQSLIKSHILAAHASLGEDPPSPSTSVDNANNSYFITQGGKVKLRKHNGNKLEIRKVSELPFRDLVLVPHGNKLLTDEAVAYIKKFTDFVKTTNVVFEGGRFQCPGSIAGSTGSACRIMADRLCPLYYSASQPALRANSVELLSIPGRTDGRVLVHLDNSAPPIPEQYRREIVYAGVGSRETSNEDEESNGNESWYEFVSGDWKTLCRMQSGVLCRPESDTFMLSFCTSDLPGSITCQSDSTELLKECTCERCQRVTVEDGLVFSEYSQECLGRVKELRHITKEELTLEDNVVSATWDVSACLDKFPVDLSISQLARMCNRSEEEVVGVVIEMAAEGHVRAVKTCYGKAATRNCESVGNEPRRGQRRLELLARWSALLPHMVIDGQNAYLKASGKCVAFTPNPDGTAHCTAAQDMTTDGSVGQAELSLMEADTLIGRSKRESYRKA